MLAPILLNVDMQLPLHLLLQPVLLLLWLVDTELTPSQSFLLFSKTFMLQPKPKLSLLLLRHSVLEMILKKFSAQRK